MTAKAVAAELADLCVNWGKMVFTGNAKGLADMYTVDCNVFPPGVPMCDGREAFEKFVEAQFVAGLTGAKLTPATIQPGADDTPEGATLYERGDYEFYKNGDDTILDTGTYLALWKKIDGKLMVYMDIWNSNGTAGNGK